MWNRILLLSVLILAGCGQVDELRSARLEQATEFNLRAQRAFHRGEYQVAESLYENALRIDVAIENTDGIAVNTLNLAKVSQIQGDVLTAMRYLDALLEDRTLHYPAVHLAAAATQKSLLLMQTGDASTAAIWIDRADAECGKDCVLTGVIGNARASVALALNEADKALALSERAAADNKGKSTLEYANSLRLQASAHLQKHEYETALHLLDEALGLDKSLGLPEKIRQDLLLSAQACEQADKPGLAAQFKARAARITAANVK